MVDRLHPHPAHPVRTACAHCAAFAALVAAGAAAWVGLFLLMTRFQHLG